MRLATATDYGTTDGEHVWSNPPQIVTGPMVRRHPPRRPLPGVGLETKAFLQREALAISSGTEKAKQETLAHDVRCIESVHLYLPASPPATLVFAVT